MVEKQIQLKYQNIIPLTSMAS